MIRYIVILIFLVTFGKMGYTQLKINGKIISEKDGTIIPYTTIFSKEDGKGTISNEEGQFELWVDELPISIEVSHVLYDSRQIIITDVSNTIQLTPAVLELPTALSDGKYAFTLIEKALGKVKKENIIFRGEGFYRQVTKQNNNYTEALEAFTNITYSNQGIHEWKIKNGRYARIKEKNSFRYTNFSYFTRGFITYPKKRIKGKNKILHPLDLEAQKYYFDPEKHIYKQEQEIIVVHCYPRTKHQHSPHIEAWYYIDTKTYDIFQIEAKIPHDMGAHFQVKDLFSKDTHYEITIHFKYQQDTDNLIIDFIKADGIFPVYQAEEYVYDNVVSSILYCYNSQTSRSKRKKKAKLEVDDLASIAKAVYDPSSWQNSSLVKRNPLEEKVFKDFEKNGYWGNFFDN